MAGAQQPHDIVIIGAGPAGLAAGLYAARARRRTVLLELADHYITNTFTQ